MLRDFERDERQPVSVLRSVGRRLVPPVIVACMAVAAGCDSHRAGAGDQADRADRADCLPKTNLVDQNGNNFSLDALKGKPVLVDFIYTSCPGPCMMLTAKLANVALRLGPDLGSKAALLSITVDPEHDQPKDLLKYAKDQGAEQKGWTFLTGPPAEVERVMNLLKLQRESESDGSVGHVADMFLIGPNGRELKEYSGSTAKPQDIVADMKKAAGQG